MKIRLLIASALVGSLLSGGLPLAARAGEHPSAVTATGHMTVSAPSSAYVDLRVPRDVRLSLNYWSRKPLPVPRFSSTEGFAAMVLASQDQVGITYDAFHLPDARGIVQRNVSLGMDFCQLDRACKIPAGNYRLFLVPDGPVRVEIELQGLRGKSSLRIDDPVVGDISGATESYFHSTPRGDVELAAHGVGFSPRLTGEHNFLFSAFWFRGPARPAGPAPADKPLVQVGNAGGCLFTGSPPAESYAPGCPTGSMHGSVSTARALDHFGYQQWGSSANIAPGPYGDGYYAVHTGIRDPGFVGFWLDLTN